MSVWFRGDVGPDGTSTATAHGVRLDAELERT